MGARSRSRFPRRTRDGIECEPTKPPSRAGSLCAGSGLLPIRGKGGGGRQRRLSRSCGLRGDSDQGRFGANHFGAGRRRRCSLLRRRFPEGGGDRSGRGFRESGANQFRPSGPESGEIGKMPCFTGSCGCLTTAGTAFGNAAWPPFSQLRKGLTCCSRTHNLRIRRRRSASPVPGSQVRRGLPRSDMRGRAL